MQLFEFNRYYDTISGAYRYWTDPQRALSGKEQLKYDLGDGNGFQNLGANPKISYPYPGTYKISMAVRDSAGCWDTLYKFNTVNISGVYADFLLPFDSVFLTFCAFIVTATFSKLSHKIIFLYFKLIMRWLGKR